MVTLLRRIGCGCELMLDWYISKFWLSERDQVLLFFLSKATHNPINVVKPSKVAGLKSGSSEGFVAGFS